MSERDDKNSGARRRRSAPADRPIGSTAQIANGSSETTDRRIVPMAEAIERIGPNEYVHTFVQGGFCLIGCDHERDRIIAAMRKYGVEDSGDQASAMGHTLVIVNYPTYDKGTTPLFIEAKPTAS